MIRPPLSRQFLPACFSSDLRESQDRVWRRLGQLLPFAPLHVMMAITRQLCMNFKHIFWVDIGQREGEQKRQIGCLPRFYHALSRIVTDGMV